LYSFIEIDRRHHVDKYFCIDSKAPYTVGYKVNCNVTFWEVTSVNEVLKISPCIILSAYIQSRYGWKIETKSTCTFFDGINCSTLQRFWKNMQMSFSYFVAALGQQKIIQKYFWSWHWSYGLRIMKVTNCWLHLLNQLVYSFHWSILLCSKVCIDIDNIYHYIILCWCIVCTCWHCQTWSSVYQMFLEEIE